MVGPAVDRAQAVDLMVRVAEKARAAVWVSPFSARCSFPGAASTVRGFSARLAGAALGRACATMIWSSSSARPVFTFHVEGHASIFDGATAIFQITDDPTAAAVTPRGTSIIATMKPALTMLLELLPEIEARDCRQAARCRLRQQAADPIAGRISAAHAVDADA